ncbi:hypothetical protein [Nitrobacter hamburgensis]|uniref:hypothetical protein n=1 Tax=Nitrobacter hamburgensis TaxID=912 RepID=UPI0000555624|nr:hypothetical protein [Nitrobacter hamburgensis]
MRASAICLAAPDRADEMEEIIARYGEVQHRFEELDGYSNSLLKKPTRHLSLS